MPEKAEKSILASYEKIKQTFMNGLVVCLLAQVLFLVPVFASPFVDTGGDNYSDDAEIAFGSFTGC